MNGFREYFIIPILFIGVSIISCSDEECPLAREELPDLVIDDISYVCVSRFDSLYGGSNLYEFSVNIFTIGTDPLSERFYVANTRFHSDFDNDEYCHGQVVNYEHNTIEVGGFLEESIQDVIPDKTDSVKFFIVTDGKAVPEGIDLSLVEELDYSNNYYFVVINRE